MRLPIQNCSSRFAVRELSESNLADVYALCRANPDYYSYLKSEPTPQNLRRTMSELPPRKTMEDKYFLGYFQASELIAVLDLIAAYPEPETAYLGWLILKPSVQGRGIGTAIASDLCDFLRGEHFRAVELGCVEDNRQAAAFWQKNGFQPTGRVTETPNYRVVALRKDL